MPGLVPGIHALEPVHPDWTGGLFETWQPGEISAPDEAPCLS
jgi:hypothetical protein